jgi:NitT/TauT family transport system permease protein
MMSMSGGWFFIVASEAISIANTSIMLPGVGSYIATALYHQNLTATGYAIIAMLIVIILYDQLFFRPLVAWSEKFKLTDIPEEEHSSWILDFFQKSRLMTQWTDWFKQWMAYWFLNHRFWCKRLKPGRRHALADQEYSFWSQLLWIVSLIVLIGGLAFWFDSTVLQHVSWSQVGAVSLMGGYTFLRVITLILLCSFVWVPIGIWAGLRPRVARIVQPVAQILAAFPTNLFFPIFIFFIFRFHLNMNIWCAPLMVLGTQWYILFNVIAGATMIPKELKLAAQNFNLQGWLKWRRFYLPAVFPYFVTGAITAAGGAWNASIIAEVVTWGSHIYHATGLGAYITLNTRSGDFTNVALGVVIMCIWVTVFNFFFWRKLYHYAETRFALNAQ